MSTSEHARQETPPDLETDTGNIMAPNLINEVLLDYIRLRTMDDHADESLQQTFLQWVRIKRELQQENRTHGSLFNPLQFITIRETSHSMLMGDLLNPKGSHGQGGHFLESFLKFIGVTEPTARGWDVTVERGRIDILLRRRVPPGVVIIENKSNEAVDQKNQLYRYWYRLIYLPYPTLNQASESFRRSFRIVYLTPRASKEPVGDSLERPPEFQAKADLPNSVPRELLQIVTFNEILKHWLTDAKFAVSETNLRLRTFLQLYSELWEQS